MPRLLPAPASSPPQPRAARDAETRLVDRAVADLRRVVYGGQLDTLLAVGEYVIENFYGSADEARARKPRKAASLRRLVERADEFGMKANGVRLSVPIALQARTLGRGLSARLSSSQHRALLPVSDPQEKKLLAEAAVDGHWSYQKLRGQVVKIRKPHPGGRPREPIARVILRRVERALAADDLARAESERLPPSEAKGLLASANRLRATMERLELMLQRRALSQKGAKKKDGATTGKAEREPSSHPRSRQLALLE
jgi:hypothetical protein